MENGAYCIGYSSCLLKFVSSLLCTLLCTLKPIKNFKPRCKQHPTTGENKLDRSSIFADRPTSNQSLAIQLSITATYRLTQILLLGSAAEIAINTSSITYSLIPTEDNAATAAVYKKQPDSDYFIIVNKRQCRVCGKVRQV